jgi:hypothetical protein
MRKSRSFTAARKLKLLAPLLSLSAIAACGGGDGGDMTPNVVTNVSPGGIYNGTDSASGLQLMGIVDEAGDFDFIRFDGVQFVGNAVTTGNSLSANFSGFMPFGATFEDDSTHGAGTLSGTVQPRASISATSQFRTDNGTSTNSTIALTFSSLYDVASSLATISGTYTDPNSGNVITVTSGGQMSWQDATTGCVGSGSISIINAAYNAYRVQFSYSDCSGSVAVLNGVPFTGLATLNNGVATVGVTGNAAGANYALVITLNHA